MAASADDVIAQRLRTQRLTSAPLADPADVVRLLLCVQSQDPPLARYSLGMRTKDEADANICAAIDDGRILRTHILRPTWHFVAPEDLRWILALTSPKVVSSMAARHRQLRLEPAVVDRAHEQFVELLAGRRFLTRRAIAAKLKERGSPYANDQLGHLLLLAELRALVCSGPLERGWHTYGLVDELVPPSPARDREDAVRDLVWRFFTGHGPAAITDLTRWTTLTQTDIKPALEDLDDRLETFSVDGVQQWFDPAADALGERGGRAFLLPTFDEAYLSYPKVNVPRADGHPAGESSVRFLEAGGGVVVFDRREVGWWRRTNSGKRVEVRLTLATSLGRPGRRLIEGEVKRLAAFTDRSMDVVHQS